MNKYEATGVHGINKWLWGKLQTLEVDPGVKAFAAYATNGLVPIIASQQMPEFIEISGGAPFIVYTYTTSVPVQDYTKRQQAAWMIYDNDERRLRTIHNYMIDVLSQFANSAQAVNSVMTGDFSHFDFKFIRVINATSPDPATEEGGRQQAMVVAAYEFSIDSDTAGLRL